MEMVARAHCDVPCGVYETDTMNHAVDTCRKLVKKMLDSSNSFNVQQASPKERAEYLNFMARSVHVKDEYAQICKRELLILWTDWFKEEHLKKWPDLHAKIWKATKLCSEVKRSVDADKVEQLQKAVDEVAKIFAESKKA